MLKKIIEHLFDKISQTSSQKAFETALLLDSCCQIKGVVGSGLNFKLVTAFKNLNRNQLIIFYTLLYKLYTEIYLKNKYLKQ